MSTCASNAAVRSRGNVRRTIGIRPRVHLAHGLIPVGAARRFRGCGRVSVRVLVMVGFGVAPRDGATADALKA